MEAAESVLKRLKAKNIQPVELAKAIGVTGAMASMILSGKRGLAVWHLDAVARLLGVSVPELFTNDPARHSSQVQHSGGSKTSAGTVSLDTPRLDAPEVANAGHAAPALDLHEREALIDACLHAQVTLRDIRAAASDAYDRVSALLDQFGFGFPERQTSVARADTPADGASVRGRDRPHEAKRRTTKRAR